MLSESKEDFCFGCHGPVNVSRTVQAKTDIQAEFNKMYVHPVRDTSMYHFPAEELPEQNPVTPRHVSCADCHRVHVLEPGDTLRGVKGYVPGRGIGQTSRRAQHEYEVCYRCHSDSANLPPGSTNKADEFFPSNPSYHPIEAAGRNKNVPSLIGNLNENSIISCDDCHGNDDPFGPKGPHGSRFEHLLKFGYVEQESAESPNTYELCYSCHERDSVIGNISFQKHREHIVFNRIPCSACHNPHGSVVNPNLIEFAPLFVDASPQPIYSPQSPGKPMCFLSCHVGGVTVVHDSDFYTAKHWP